MASTDDREAVTDDHRPRHPHYEHRLLWIAVLGTAPFLILVLVYIFGVQLSTTAGLAWLVVALGAWWVALVALRRQAAYPLRTVATLLEALREGDYLHRGRMDIPGDALGELIREVNELRDTLHDQRMKVQETVALLAKVIETVDIAVLTFGPDHRLRLANATGRNLIGIGEKSTDELLSLSASDLGLDPLLETTGFRSMEQEFAGSVGRYEIRHRTFREGGEIHHLLVVADLSRVLREEERQAWQKLIRVLGHEINNSLAPIQSISEALEARIDVTQLDPELGEDLTEGLGLIASRSAALERFVKGYTLLAKLPEPDRQPTDLSALVRRVVQLEGAPRVRLEGEPLMVEVDEAQLEQVLINLVKNAIEAGSNDDVLVRWRNEGGSTVIEVDDEGDGLPPSENLFVPFFTTKPGGNGIGLVLSQRIAEAHGGRLELSNREPRGARARLWLPPAA